MKTYSLLFAVIFALGLLACGGGESEETEVSEEAGLEMKTEFESVEKRVLMASLIRQKTDLEYRIREIQSHPGGTTPPAGDLGQLKTYVDDISREITKVRQTPDGQLAEVEKTAMAAIEGAGALLQSSYMRIDSGF
ncbi:hypothetical protein [Tunicatimonas pelagia]|uniref:hypothetical protein n=1 Tax=Tunicatimonas pelagia TaxID=931531 RepID=UPI00266562F8|nr:hypothetical protein [Tunicatimonas pelagia]WKN46146.1 hypothetical protein P0M28_14420 [Tunicatimonas pelagia]